MEQEEASEKGRKKAADRKLKGYLKGQRLSRLRGSISSSSIGKSKLKFLGKNRGKKEREEADAAEAEAMIQQNEEDLFDVDMPPPGTPSPQVEAHSPSPMESEVVPQLVEQDDRLSVTYAVPWVEIFKLLRTWPANLEFM